MKQKLFLLLCALLTMIGVQQAKAYSTSDLTSAGWTQVTNLSALTLSDNYFVLVDAGASATAMAIGNPASGDRPSYTALASPFAASQQVWNIESSGSGYKLQSIVNSKYFNSGSAGWNDSMSDTGTELTFTLDNGKYRISCSTGHAGPWNNNGAVSLTDGYENVALNKSESQAPGFYIYSISRTAYNAARRNGAALAAEGWSQVTAASGLNLSGYYYALLDVSEAGYESGFAMTGATGGRPQSQALTDPVTNKAQSWIIKSHDTDKYVLQCAQDSKYFRCDGAGWNTGFTDNIDADGTDFTFAVSDGKWTLSNEKDAGNFVGRWGSSVFHPFQGESIAANKSAGAGKKQYLIYSIPTIAAVATELPANGDMAADTWYYIDIQVAGDDYKATATNLENIVYSGDAGTTVLPKLTTNHFTATNNNLAAQRYYVKSTSANNLVIAAASYTYEVGSPTPSIADGDYTYGTLSTFEFNFSSAGSNDPDAVFAILNNTTKASLKKGGIEQAQGTLSLNGKVLKATFDDVALDQSSTYVIDVAEDVVGYEGHAANSAISTSFKTGVIANGEYYFQKKNTQTYLGRGGDWGTRAVVTELGFSLDVSVLPNGKYYLKNHEWSLAANTSKYLGYTSDIFVDRGADTYSIEAATGGFILKTHDGKYVKTSTNSSNDVPYDYLDVTETEGDAIIWVPVSKETYLANVAALRNAEASAIATSAGKSASTVAELASLLASDFGATDVTSNIKNADCTDNLDNWTQVNYAVGNKNFDANGVTGEVWNGFGGIKQEINGLAEGIYKVSIHATWRPGDKASGERAADDINTNAWVYANTATSNNLTQLKSWYAGGASIDSRADMKNSGDTYLNDVYVYVSEGETLTVGLASPSTCNGAWLPFFGWSLTYYEAKATPAEKAALADAIEFAEALPLGFEEGEYAPYENVEPLEALAAAKAIDPETASGAAVVAATEALNGATWTANAEEVNAVWDGSFEYDYRATTPSGNINPYGWQRVKDAAADGYNVRYQDSDDPGLAATSSHKALFTKQSAYYGYADGYTMPLKANTVYKVTFVYGGWNDCKKDGYVSMTDPEGNPISLTVTDLPLDATTAHQDPNAWKTYTAYFTTGEAGNYVLGLRKKNYDTSGQSQYVYGDIVLKKSEGANLKVADGKLGTFIAPFNVTLPDNVKAYSATVENNEVKLSKIDNDEIEAGTPIIVYGDGVSVDQTFYGVPTVEENKTVGNLVGILNESEKTVPVGAYVLQTQTGGQAFYKVASAAPGALNRCYVIAASPNARLVITFDGEDPTAINAIEAAEAEDGALKDGKYIIDNKVVIVKNGVKYSANGQILK